MDDWTGDFFRGPWAEVQRAWAGDPEGSADGIVSLLGLSPGDRVLDAPCGLGRISLPLAARGIRVTGVDRNLDFVAEAREAAAERGVEASFREGDLREIADEGAFDAVVNWWGSFGYFDEAGNRRFAAAACRALVPGGRMVIDAPAAEGLLPHFGPRNFRPVGDMLVLEGRTYDLRTGRIEVDWTFLRAVEGGYHDHGTFHTSIRLYAGHELVALLSEAGFSKVELFADVSGAPFHRESIRQVAVATK